MHVSLRVLFIVSFYTVLLCSKSTSSLRFDLIPEDVRNVVDDNIVTPARHTLLGLLARKMGVIDFFINLVRGTKHTFFGENEKERRKPRNGFPRHTTRKYKPTFYPDIVTANPYANPNSNFRGIYTMIAPDLRTTSESWLDSEVVEGIKSIRGRDVEFSFNSKGASKLLLCSKCSMHSSKT